MKMIGLTKFKKNFYRLLPFLTPVICSLFGLSVFDEKIFDFFKSKEHSLKENEEICLLNIDDTTISNIGNWPLSRDVYADCISVLKEHNANSIVFDLSFLDKSKSQLSDSFSQKEFMEDLSKYLDWTFQESEPSPVVNENIKDFINEKLNKNIKDVDSILSKTIAEAENVYLTLTFDNKYDLTEDEEDILESKIELKNVTSENDTVTPNSNSVQPAIFDFLKGAKSAGFVNGKPDKDGYNRRCHLLWKHNGKYYAQLIFKALLDKMENPQIVVSNNKILLKNAKIGEIKKDIVIPRAKDGSFILKYPKAKYENYKNSTSFWNIYRIKKLEEEYNDYLEYIEEIDGIENLDAEEAKYFSKLSNELISSRDWIKKLCNDNKTIFIIGTTASSTTDFSLTQYEEQYPNVGVYYTIANQILDEDFFSDSNIFVSILVAFVICIIYSFLFTKIKAPMKLMTIGFSFILALILTSYVYFLITKTFIGLTIPLTSFVFVFLIRNFDEFHKLSKEKKIIIEAFSQCLSKSIVNQIIANPSSFKLGGENREMTAIFTDIQKFSSFSELLTASELVSLLNFYLTKMSDIIMEESGTIDKYEGDAIIAFVGAPLKIEDHAIKACKAALKMKEAEKIMNEQISEVASKNKPDDMDEELYKAFKTLVKNKKSIFTRIGINSGEMIAGYMGSDNKKNYTMMGNNVNLASRLEGVNKQYITNGILISEYTKELLKDKFIVRSLDMVQVVNINTPIKLYELIDEKTKTNKDLQNYINDWEVAMEVFRDGNYQKALEYFDLFTKTNSNDNVAKYYKNLIESFFIKEKYPTENDHIGVTYNPELKVFKLLQK